MHMRVFIKLSNGKIITLDTKPTDKLKAIEYQFQSIENLKLTNRHKFIFEDKVITKEKTLADYDIKYNTTVHLKIIPIEYVNIFIKTHTEQTITLNLEILDSIKSVKELIQDKEGIPASQQALTFEGKELSDNLSLFDYNIQKDSSLNLFLSPCMRIFVVTLTKKTITLQVQSSDTIESVKSKIEDKEGIPASQHSLIFANKILKGEKTFKNYSIEQGSILQMELRFCEGRIIVKIPQAKIAVLYANSNASIENVAKAIQLKARLKVGEYKLLLANKILDNKRTLGDYLIQNEVTPCLELKPNKTIYIFVKFLSGKVITTDTKSFETILDFKYFIQDKEDIPLNQQRWVFNGNLLDDRKTFDFYNIQTESLIQFV